jgi:hypothetical protein
MKKRKKRVKREKSIERNLEKEMVRWNFFGKETNKSI